MRILMLNHNVAFGGNTFQRVFYLAQQFARFGHSPTVISISKDSRLRFREQEKDGVKIVLSPDLFWGIGRTGWDPWDTARRTVYALRRHYDIVYAFDSRPAVLGPALAYSWYRQVPLIMDWADWWGRGGTIKERSFRVVSTLMEPLETWLEETFRKSATRTTVISRALRERAIGLGVDPQTILKVPNGCDVEGILPVGRDHARRSLDLPLDVPLIGHLGHLYPRDARLLADTLDIVFQRRSDVKFLLLGNPGVAFKKYWPSGKGTLTPGFVPDEALGTWLCACDALILPYSNTVHNQGRWPGKVNAYFSAGRPVVATAVGEIKELLETHPAGILSEPVAEELAAATLQLLDHGSQDTFSAEARRLAENELAWPTIAEPVLRHITSAA